MDKEREQEIIERSRKEPEAFGEIFEAYYPAIFRYAVYRTGNAEVSGDIAAETFFKALNKLHTYRKTTAPFSSWLYKIANNEANYFFRKKKYEPASYDAAVEDGGFLEPPARVDIEKEFLEAQEIIEKNRDFTEVKEAVAKMPVKYQEVIVLRYLEGKKINEIAQILGKSEGTIKSLVSRGINMLRKHFLADKMQPFGDVGIITNERIPKKGRI